MNATLPMPPLAKVMIGVTFLMLFAGGIGLVVKGFKTIEESRESRTWPMVPGKIVRSEVVTETSTDRHRGTNRNRTTSSTTHRARIEYEFDVNGERHVGTRVTIAESITNHSIAQAAVSKYPVDRAVLVSYKPSDPSICVLEPGNWNGAIVYFALGVFFLSIPLILLLITRKFRPTTPAARTDTFSDQPDWET